MFWSWVLTDAQKSQIKHNILKAERQKALWQIQYIFSKVVISQRLFICPLYPVQVCGVSGVYPWKSGIEAGLTPEYREIACSMKQAWSWRGSI